MLVTSFALLILISVLLSNSLSFKYAQRKLHNTMQFSISKQKQTVSTDIVARDIELTDPLRARVSEKIEKTIQKLGHNDVLSASVILRVIKYPLTEVHSQTTKKDSQIAEVTVGFRGGGVLHASERTDDMYASIDIVAHKVAQSLKKHNEKARSKRFKEKSQFVTGAGKLSAEDIAEIDSLSPPFNEEELLLDLDVKYKNVLKPSGLKPEESNLEVIRPKYFPMPPISVSAALSALELIDHPFYVFRNEETNEINVVYRRTHGGVGLIMPEK